MRKDRLREGVEIGSKLPRLDESISTSKGQGQGITVNADSNAYANILHVVVHFLREGGKIGGLQSVTMD